MHFEENQLSLSSISISPLPTAHPSRFQPTMVRASIPCYREFTLAMGRSLSFGSNPRYWAPCSDSLSLRLLPILGLTSQRKLTRRFIMQKARHYTFQELDAGYPMPDGR